MGHLPRGQAALRPGWVTPSASTSSRPTSRTATPGRTARRWPAGCAAGCSGRTTPPTEGDAHDRSATPTCNARRPARSSDDLHGKSVFDLNAERATELARNRPENRAGNGKDGLLADVRRLTALRDPIKPAGREDRGETKRGDGTVRKLVFTTEPGIEVPARLFTPGKADATAPLTVVVGYEAAEAIGPDGPVEVLLGQGRRVLVADLRGMGETAPAGARPGPLGADTQGGVPLAPPGPPPARAAGRRPARGDRRTRRRVPGRRGPHRPRGRRADRAARRGARAQGRRADARRRDHVLVRGRPHAADAGPARQRRPRGARVVRPARPGRLARPSAVDHPGGGRPDGAAGYSGAGRRGLSPRPTRLPRARCGGRAGPEGRPAPADADAPGPDRRPVGGRIADRHAGRRQDRDGQAARRGRAPRPDPLGGPRGDGSRSRSTARRSRCRRATTSLPVAAGGVQVDCPITGGYRSNSSEDPWGLVKDARIRLWPAGSPWIEPTSFVYPARQRWFASTTQMANEPVYVDGGEKPATAKIYYHNGLDIGGAEGLVEVVAATDGVVVSSGTARLAGFEDTPVRPRYDVVYLLDDRGWYYRYSHMQTIDPAIEPGATVRMGQKIGVLGKEGGSGGWSHLHFEITSRQPSGRWGTQEGYAFLWQAYLREHEARSSSPSPGPTAWPGPASTVTLDGSQSWSRSGPIERFEWTFSDGTTASGPQVERTYDRPGSYSEILKVTDAPGARRLRLRRRAGARPVEPRALPPTIHAAYAPDARDQARRPGHVQGADLPDDRRPGDLGLRRRQPARRRSARTATSISTPRTATPSRPTASPSRATTSSASSGPTAAGPTATARLHVVVEARRANEPASAPTDRIAHSQGSTMRHAWWTWAAAALLAVGTDRPSGSVGAEEPARSDPGAWLRRLDGRVLPDAGQARRGTGRDAREGRTVTVAGRELAGEPGLGGGDIPRGLGGVPGAASTRVEGVARAAPRRTHGPAAGQGHAGPSGRRLPRREPRLREPAGRWS